MKFEDVKKDLVENKGIISAKGLKGLAVKLALSTLFFDLAIVLFVFSVLPVLKSAFAFTLMLGGGILYIWLWDYCCDCEDDKQLKKVKIFANLWFVGLILLVGVFLLLKYTHYM